MILRITATDAEGNARTVETSLNEGDSILVEALANPAAESAAAPADPDEPSGPPPTDPV